MTNTDSLKQYNLLTYILYFVGFAVGITGLIAIIMNYIKRDEMRGTWLESHVDWQIKTFWWSLLGYVLSFILLFVLIGYITGLIVLVWHVYRLIKGVIALNDNKAIA